MRISVCMIVKNEEEYLEECLKYIANQVDEIVVVDTGSTDRTREIAVRYAGKCYDYSFQDDFAAARNYSLSLAAGDWIMIMDADERIDENNLNKLKKSIEQCDDNIGGFHITKYNFFKDGGWYISRGLKLFRNNPKIRFEGEVGESVSAAVKKAGYKNKEADVFVNHVGHGKPYRSRHNKNVLYLSIFSKRLKKDPNNVFLRAYVAVLERAEGHLDKAIEWIETSVELQGAKNDFMFQLFAGHVYKANERFRHAEACYRQALQIVPNEENAISNLGTIYLCMGQMEKAIAILKDGILYNPTAWFLHMNLALAYEMNEEYENAISCFDIAYQGNPFFSYYHKMAKVEEDPYRIFYYETIPHYAGYRYHRAFCSMMLLSLNENNNKH